MALGLERYRWLPYQFKQPPILINVPEFRLYAFDEKNEVGLTMRVNVGEDYNHQTPMFENNIQYIVFRPYWTPTPNILLSRRTVWRCSARAGKSSDPETSRLRCCSRCAQETLR